MISPKLISRLILLIALFLAIFFRFWQLETLPPGLYHDEAYNGLDALSLVQGKSFPIFYEGWELYAQDAHAERPPTITRFPIFFEGNYGREPLHIYLMALSINLLGATPTAVRAVPAAAGVLAVLTTYFAASMLLLGNDERKAQTMFAPAFAALTMAILYPAIHFSRFGIRAMLFVPIETMAVGLFWLGIQRLAQKNRGFFDFPSSSQPKQGHAYFYLPFIFAGILLGLGIYTYAAARLFPLLFILFIPIWLWHSKQFKANWPYAAVMAGASLVTALPLLLFFYRYPYFFIFRIAFVANKGTGTVDGRPLVTWILNIGRVVRGLFWQGETHLRHNLPGRPYLDVIQLGLFGLGSGTFFYRWNRLRPIFLAIWLVVMLLPTVMSGDAPHFGRMTGVAPVAAILIGIGAAAILKWTSRRWRSSRGQTFVGFSLVILLFALSAWLAYRDYFIHYANHPQLAHDFYQSDWELGQLAASQPDQTSIYLSPTQEEMATIYFALQDPSRIRSYAGGQGLVPLGRPNEPVLYLLRPLADNASVAQIEQLMGAPTTIEESEAVWIVNGRYNLDSFPDYVPSMHRWGDKIELKAWQINQTEAQLEVNLLWQANSMMDRSYTGFVHLINEAGLVISQKDRPPAGYPTTDWQPGEWIHDQYLVDIPPDLAAGTYRIQTGFYFLPTLEGLGEPVILEEIIFEGEGDD